MAKEADAVEQAADELYALSPADFTEARDERVKRLRADDQREAAKEVKSLRKPTLAAWALNQLVRRRKKDVQQLLAAGSALRDAQEELVASGDRAGFQRAAAKERELVAKLARDAAALAGEAGVGSTQGLEEKLVATLHAAALDEQTAAELAAGRVVRERQAVAGFGAGDGLEVAAPPPPKRAPKREEKADAKQRKEQAAADAEQRERLSAARLAERRAGRELDAAAKAAERAAARVEKAEERAAEAARKLDDVRAELAEAQEAEKAAREEHARATAEVRSLEK